MSRKRYAWEAVESLRRGRRTESEIELARAHTELGQANSELERAEQALRTQLEARIETQWIATGVSSGLELQRVAAHAARSARDTRRLRALVAQAKTRVAERATALQRAQHALGQARAGERVIERDRERWQDEQRRELERREQLEVDERAQIDRDEHKRGV